MVEFWWRTGYSYFFKRFFFIIALISNNGDVGPWRDAFFEGSYFLFSFWFAHSFTLILSFTPIIYLSIYLFIKNIKIIIINTQKRDPLAVSRAHCRPT